MSCNFILFQEIVNRKTPYMELSFVLSKCPFSTKLENKHSYALFSLFSVFLNTHTHTHTHTE